MVTGLVSIIVPIYNAERYLPQCIESITLQTYSKIQIILVNDGSTDHSFEICMKFMKTDERIVVINQQNKGNTAARKRGSEGATGEFVTFVDADDYVPTNMVEILMRNIDSADFISCNVMKKYDYGDLVCKSKINMGKYNDKQEIIANMFYYKDTNEFGVLPYLVGKLYKREFIRSALSELSDDIQFAEDRATMFWCIIHAKEIRFIDDVLYFYRIHEESICNSKDEFFLCKLTSFYIYVKRLFEKEEQGEILLKQLDKYMVNTTIDGLNRKIGLSQSNLIQKYYLNETVLEISENIILYGAGAVGKDYYRQLQKSRRLQVCAWVDINYKKYETTGYAVQSTDIIQMKFFDYIIVAVLKEDVFHQICESLVKMSVGKEKIIWVEPVILF